MTRHDSENEAIRKASQTEHQQLRATSKIFEEKNKLLEADKLRIETFN